jgi:hypothetical protein
VTAPSAAGARAAAFVTAHGAALDRARAEALLGIAPVEPALAALAAETAQQTLPALQRLLGVCDDLRSLHAPLVERACAQLCAVQGSDGAWSDAAADAVHATGMLGGYLAKTRFARVETLQAVGDFLAARWSPDLVQGFQWGNIAAYAHLFANFAHERSDEILQWCGRELERGYRTRAFDAVRTARILVICDAHALPGARLDAQELVAALRAEQTADGSWQPAAGATPPARVEHTLDALVALLRLGG